MITPAFFLRYTRGTAVVLCLMSTGDQEGCALTGMGLFME